MSILFISGCPRSFYLLSCANKYDDTSPPVGGTGITGNRFRGSAQEAKTSSTHAKVLYHDFKASATKNKQVKIACFFVTCTWVTT